MLGVESSYITFIVLKYIILKPTLLRIFIINRCWILSNVFSAFVEMCFSLSLVNLVCHVDWFADIETSLYPYNECHLIVLNDSCNVLLKSVCWFLKGFLNLYSLRILVYSFLYKLYIFWFGIIIMLDLKNKFEGFPSSSVFWDVLRE